MPQYRNELRAVETKNVRNMATTSKAINKADLEAYHDELMKSVIEPLTGPTYDPTNESLNFPVTAKVAYDSVNESLDFGTLNI